MAAQLSRIARNFERGGSNVVNFQQMGVVKLALLIRVY